MRGVSDVEQRYRCWFWSWSWCVADRAEGGGRSVAFCILLCSRRTVYFAGGTRCPPARCCCGSCGGWCWDEPRACARLGVDLCELWDEHYAPVEEG